MKIYSGPLSMFGAKVEIAAREGPLARAAAVDRLSARARAGTTVEHCCDEVFFPHVIRLMSLRATPDPVDHPAWIQARAAIEAYYLSMDRLLGSREYLAGPYGYADISFFMAQFFAARHTVPMSATQMNLVRWRTRMARRPAVGAVIGAMVAYLRNSGLPVPEYGGPR
jgi:glutathione S-transferase